VIAASCNGELITELLLDIDETVVKQVTVKGDKRWERKAAILTDE
jgi:hypothetical protein